MSEANEKAAAKEWRVFYQQAAKHVATDNELSGIDKISSGFFAGFFAGCRFKDDKENRASDIESAVKKVLRGKGQSKAVKMARGSALSQR